MPLSVHTAQESGRRLLQVVGELDTETSAALMASAMELIDSGMRDVLIDAGELTFCDSAGLSVFVHIANRIAPLGGRLVIAGVQPLVRRVLEISGLVEAIPLTETVEDAVKLLDASPR